MNSEIRTVSFRGIQAVGVTVQIQVAGGSLPSFAIVGLPDKAVNESKERIRSALHTMGIALPPKRITMSLSPADIQKEGNHYDLPLALGLLIALNILPADPLSQAIAIGELGLDGCIKPVRGILSAALLASSENRLLLCPEECGGEAVWGGEGDVLAPRHLLCLVNHYKGIHVLSRPEGKISKESAFLGDFSDIRGQETAKRALTIAAAGRHNVILVGPPGTGKSMLAMRMASILPPMTAQECLEVTMIHSLSHRGVGAGALMQQRPFRDPHHSVSMAALVGGGIKGLPGEISLAHQGVLFLDELPEFSRQAIDSLRQSLETQQAVVSRANYRSIYPADFQLIGAMNPCRCGYLGNAQRQCHKAPACASAYQSGLSGPFLDRIDMYLEIDEVSPAQLSLSVPNDQESPFLRKKVQYAWDFQRAQHYARHPLPGELDRILHASPEAAALMHRAIEKWSLSARTYYRIIRVARSIASLEGSTLISPAHLSEALTYRLQGPLCGV
jgi:magnesium chelatase family protein